MPRNNTRKTVAALETTVEMLPDALKPIAELLPVTETPVETEEAVVALIEAQDAQESETVEPTPAADESAPREPTFEELRDAFDDATVETTTHLIAAAIDDRAVFEDRKAPDNANIQKTLKKAREQLVTKRAARVLLATSVDPSFVNRSLHDGARYNVYALGKLADIVRGVTDGAITNAINMACMKSLFRFRKAGLDFTGEMAKAAASDKIRVEASLRQHLVRHTVSASTAPTQASSTMQALETLGVVVNVGSRKSPVYRVTDHPIVAHLEAKLAA